MVPTKNSGPRAAGLVACLTLTFAMGALTACGSAPATTTTTRSVTTDTTAPVMPTQQTTTVTRQSTTNP